MGWPVDAPKRRMRGRGMGQALGNNRLLCRPAWCEIQSSSLPPSLSPSRPAAFFTPATRRMRTSLGSVFSKSKLFCNFMLLHTTLESMRGGVASCPSVVSPPVCHIVLELSCLALRKSAENADTQGVRQRNLHQKDDPRQIASWATSIMKLGYPLMKKITLILKSLMDSYQRICLESAIKKCGSTSGEIIRSYSSPNGGIFIPGTYRFTLDKCTNDHTIRSLIEEELNEGDYLIIK